VRFLFFTKFLFFVCSRRRSHSIAFGPATAWSVFESSKRLRASLVQKGGYLFTHGKRGLIKMGTGYHGTISKHIYARNPNYRTGEKSWLAICGDKLFYRSSHIGAALFVIIDANTLEALSSFFYFFAPS